MAIGAVILSFSTAIVGALYMCVLHGLDATQGLALYALIGSLTLFFIAAITGTEREWTD